MLTKPWDFNHALDKPCCRAGVLAMRDWGQVLLVAIGKQHSPRAKPHSESRQASGKT